MQSAFKTSLKIVLASLTLSLVSCSTVKIRDYVMYGDKGIHGATGVHTLCPLEKCPPELLNKTEWDAKRIGMICMNFDVIAEIQANIDKLCARNPKTCEYEKVARARRNARHILRTQQWAGVRVSRDVLKVFEPERDLELAAAMEQAQ